MLYIILTIVAIIYVVIGVTGYCCCKLSGDISRDEERKQFEDEMKQRKLKNQTSVLSDLEKETVEKLKTEFELLFEVNKNNDITVGECMDKFENGSSTILNNGKVLGFSL